ncbi:MAG: hypothetical protein H6558_21390, partial [Lewinellaceae bacterium]|nr:hypothetical protein [Lewinellaceae bacterium]
MITVAVVMGLWFTWGQADIPYSLVIVWALAGIIARRTSGVAEVYYPAVVIAAAAGIGILGAIVIRMALKMDKG